LIGKRPDKSKGTLRTSSTEHAKKSTRACQFDTATEHLRKTISLDPGRTGAFILLGAVMEIRKGVSRHGKIIEPLFLSILLTNPPSETFRDQLEIVSRVILRHANLSTTQRYLGTVRNVEAMRWIDNLYG
jgi:hypothetical protein